jgi:hypothetical protein
MRKLDDGRDDDEATGTDSGVREGRCRERGVGLDGGVFTSFGGLVVGRVSSGRACASTQVAVIGFRHSTHLRATELSRELMGDTSGRGINCGVKPNGGEDL